MSTPLRKTLRKIGLAALRNTGCRLTRGDVLSLTMNVPYFMEQAGLEQISPSEKGRQEQRKKYQAAGVRTKNRPAATTPTGG